VVGPIAFDENGDPQEKFETIYQAKGGKFTFSDRIAVE
jgi:hypothetical protein